MKLNIVHYSALVVVLVLAISAVTLSSCASGSTENADSMGDNGVKAGSPAGTSLPGAGGSQSANGNGGSSSNGGSGGTATTAGDGPGAGGLGGSDPLGGAGGVGGKAVAGSGGVASGGGGYAGASASGGTGATGGFSGSGGSGGSGGSPQPLDLLLISNDSDVAYWAVFHQSLDLLPVNYTDLQLTGGHDIEWNDLQPYDAVIWFDDDASHFGLGNDDCYAIYSWLHFGVGGDRRLFIAGRGVLGHLWSGSPGTARHDLYGLLATVYTDQYVDEDKVNKLLGAPGDLLGGDFVAPNELSLSMSLARYHVGR